MGRCIICLNYLDCYAIKVVICYVEKRKDHKETLAFTKGRIIRKPWFPYYLPEEPRQFDPLEVDGPSASIVATISTKIGTRPGAHI